ncbi:hypothetical protein T439DRAFT_376171 [Meredithblackwellia eburnea MCA 4105]
MKFAASTFLLVLVSSKAIASYAPTITSPCSSNVTLRLGGTPQSGNQTLNSDEAAYIQARKTAALASLKTYLGPLASSVFNGSLDLLTTSTMPTLGIAISGGSERASLFGAGVVATLDGRNTTSVNKTLGGVLQSATYMSALSGGSWFLSSLLLNDFPSSIYQLVLGGGNQTGWNLDISVTNPGNVTQQGVVVQQILSDLAAKKDAGPFNVTIGDYWARALSRHFLPGTSVANFFDNQTTDHGASLLLSSATGLSSWSSHAMPFPLMVTTVLSVNEKAAPLSGDVVPLQNVVYEFSPLEFGSYDPELSAFISLKNLGTSLNAGTVVNDQCVTGFDNAGFLFGISSNLFAEYNITQSAAWTSPVSPINAAWTLINSTFYSVQPNQQLDISAVPNPFKGLNNGSYEDSNQDQLRLLDGGLDGQVDPLAPLLVKARGVDTIIVADASADTAANKPDGSSLLATAARQSVLPNGTYTFPPMPNSTATFISQGLATRPTFFGCQAATGNASSYPLIIYLPNADPHGVTNTSTTILQYSAALSSAFLDSTVSIVSGGINGTDSQWPTCLACAVVERGRAKAGVNRTSACTACFNKYCWSGSNTGNGYGSATGTGGSGTGAKSAAPGQVKAFAGLAVPALVAAILLVVF